MAPKVFDSESFCGYKQISTFYTDFGIAESFGEVAVKDTYRRIMQEWKTDYKYLTELVLVLCWKIGEHYEDNTAMAELYSELWGKADQYALDHLKGEELGYFLATTD